MAYYNGFPATYQPMYPTYTGVQMPQQNASQAQQQSGLIWIQGEQAAKSYLVAPNSTVVLFDSEAQVIYLKSADASGMPSIKVLDYTIRESNRNAPNIASTASVESLSIYATKDEINAISERITAIQEKVNSLSRKRNNQEVSGDE